MRLAGVGQRIERGDVLLREGNLEILLQELQPDPELLQPVRASLLRHRADRRRRRIVPVAEDVILAERVFAGKLRAEQKPRIAGTQKLADLFATLDRVVIGHGKDLDPGVAHDAKQFRRRIGAVGDRGMHVQIDERMRHHGGCS